MWTAGRIAQLLGVPCEGPEDRILRTVAPLGEAGPDALTFAVGRQRNLGDIRAGAVILAEGTVPASVVAIRHPEPRWAFATVARVMCGVTEASGTRHPTAVVAEDALVPETVTLGPYAVVGPGARLGEECRLGAHAVVEGGAVLGRACVLATHAVVCGNATLGDRVEVGPHAVVGADGFGVAIGKAGLAVFPQVGTTVIGEDVGVGPSSVVCRGALGKTQIGRGTRLDSFVQVAHNVTIGEEVLMAAFAGVAGGSTIGDRVQMGGRAGVIDGRTVGAGARLAALASVWRDVGPGAVVGGIPAVPHRQWLRQVAALNKLPAALRRWIRETE